MLYTILILIVLTNFIPFLIPQMDIWHAQGVAVQSIALVIFSLSFFLTPKFKETKNIWLLLINLWVGGYTAFICFRAQVVSGKYDIYHFFAYFNLICILFIYKAIVQYLDKDDIVWVYRFLKYSIIITAIICVLQYLNLGQFWQLLNPHPEWHNNIVNGFIGNGTHLAGFLGMCFPLFLYQVNRENVLALILLTIILFTITGTNRNDPSMSGIVTAICSTLFYFRNKTALIIVTVISLLGGIVAYKFYPYFLDSMGRIGLFQHYWPLVKQYFITGIGLGGMNLIYSQTAYPDIRHMHLEYYHFLLEVGFISIVLIIGFINSFLRQQSEGMERMFQAMFVGFLVSCLFNYSAHLWLFTAYAVIAYGCSVALKREAEIAS